MPYKDKKKQSANAIKWNKEHPKRRKIITKKWQVNNPQKMAIYYKKYRNTPAGLFIQKIKRKGSNMKMSEFIDWYSKQKKECIYCNITEEQLCNNKKFVLSAILNKLTIDRINPDGEYILENIVLSCMRCNMIKSNFFSHDEMKEIGLKYVRPKINK